jgi:hypothetical protein
MARGPTPPENNPPINPQYFQPSRFVISAITRGQITTVTTSVNHNYVVGQQIRLLLPKGFGCRDLNETTSFVQSVPAANQIVLSLYSVGQMAFNGAALSTVQPQTIAMGNINTGAINASGPSSTLTYIPASFINISPN